MFEKSRECVPYAEQLSISIWLDVSKLLAHHFLEQYSSTKIWTSTTGRSLSDFLLEVTLTFSFFLGCQMKEQMHIRDMFQVELLALLSRPPSYCLRAPWNFTNCTKTTSILLLRTLQSPQPSRVSTISSTSQQCGVRISIWSKPELIIMLDWEPQQWSNWRYPAPSLRNPDSKESAGCLAA